MQKKLYKPNLLLYRKRCSFSQRLLPSQPIYFTTSFIVTKINRTPRSAVGTPSVKSFCSVQRANKFQAFTFRKLLSDSRMTLKLLYMCRYLNWCPFCQMLDYSYVSIRICCSSVIHFVFVLF